MRLSTKMYKENTIESAVAKVCAGALFSDAAHVATSIVARATGVVHARALIYARRQCSQA